MMNIEQIKNIVADISDKTEQVFVRENGSFIELRFAGREGSETHQVSDLRTIVEQDARIKALEEQVPKWISVEDCLPSENEQVEVVFYKSPYEWWTGLFTPKGFTDDNDKAVFQYHQHWGDDCYHTVDGVTHWMLLPKPPKE